VGLLFEKGFFNYIFHSKFWIMTTVLINSQPIDIASPFVADVADLVSKLIKIDADGDGSISVFEGLNAGQVLIFKVMAQYQKAPEALEQLKDADSSERKELLSVFNQAFDLSNDEAEQLIEDTFSYLETTITDGVQLGKRWKGLFAE
jgi:hypothetical protein